MAKGKSVLFRVSSFAPILAIAVALLVAMLAQLVTHRRYEGLFGSTLTHHYVLVDDKNAGKNVIE